MGLMDFIRKQFLDVIEWEDDSSDTLVYKYPMQDNEIQNNGKLIVRQGQAAVFVNEGQIADVFIPGTYTLNTQNLPLLTNLMHWTYAFNSPFKSDVIFVNTKQILNQKWGTPNPIMVSDPKFEQVQVRAFGTYTYKIADPQLFVTQVTSTNRYYTTSDIKEQLVAFIRSNFNVAISSLGITVVEMTSKTKDIGTSMEKSLDEEFKKLGLDVTSFNVESITLPEELNKVLNQRTSINMLGGMAGYAQVQTLDAMKESVNNPGMNAMNQAGLGLGMGVGMGNAFAGNLQGAFNNPQAFQNSPPPSVVQPQPANTVKNIDCPNCKAQVNENAKFCNECGTKIELPKGKFCGECGAKQESNSKFCNECGAKLG